MDHLDLKKRPERSVGRDPVHGAPPPWGEPKAEHSAVNISRRVQIGMGPGYVAQIAMRHVRERIDREIGPADQEAKVEEHRKEEHKYASVPVVECAMAAKVQHAHIAAIEGDSRH